MAIGMILFQIFSVIFMGLTLINDLVLWRRSTSDFPKCNSAHLKYYEFVSYMETSVTFPLALVSCFSC